MADLVAFVLGKNDGCSSSSCHCSITVSSRQVATSPNRAVQLNCARQGLTSCECYWRHFVELESEKDDRACPYSSEREFHFFKHPPAFLTSEFACSFDWRVYVWQYPCFVSHLLGLHVSWNNSHTWQPIANEQPFQRCFPDREAHIKFNRASPLHKFSSFSAFNQRAQPGMAVSSRCCVNL